MILNFLRWNFPFKQLIKRTPLFRPLLRSISCTLNPYLYRRFEIIKQKNINIVLDVGAHRGEFGIHLRQFGYSKKIISFEPVSASFAKLTKLSKKDPLWECHNFALGNKEETKKIHILNCTPASSFLEASDLLIENYGDMMRKQNEESVQVKRLDQILPQLCKPSDSVFLKMDTQGFEKNVLEGAGKYLQKIPLVLFEVSLVPAYKNEPLIAEMIEYMAEKGFIPVSIEPGDYNHTTMQQLQVDILFWRK
ncbi:MAG TPA: FkbM family methyltransferase [Chlamydiales bacterium]|nr:FkbM family methyltransferase [Chlamydiales bacterium]